MHATRNIDIHLPVQVEGENPYGDLILLQEYPSLDRGDTYLRVFVKKEQAEALAMEILAWAKGTAFKS
jgi:hypothetical protein